MRAFRRKLKIKVEPIELRDVKSRDKISRAKLPFLAAVQKVIDELQDFWPLSIRQIFYQLLNDPPLIHASKPDSRFRNNYTSYERLLNLVTRARHEGRIPYDVIEDETRTDVVWNVHANLRAYFESQTENLLNDYSRDLMQSQPNYVQIVVEKNTMGGVVRPVAAKFTIPYQIGRGQNTTTPIWKIAKRFKQQSDKDKLIVLAMSDLDPDGDAIAHSIAQRLRDDHDIDNVELIKVALTMQQARGLPESPFEKAKEKSPNFKRYVERYRTTNVWELEAVPPRTLQQLLEQHIKAVIDRKAFKTERDHEREDGDDNARVRAVMLQTLRQQIETITR
jgi:hypothetical protein